MSEQAERDELHPLHLALFLIGGLCTGFGILNLYWSFGVPSATAVGERVPLNADFGVVGFSGIDNLSALGMADAAIPLLVVGVACLVLANSSAWRETDGY